MRAVKSSLFYLFPFVAVAHYSYAESYFPAELISHDSVADLSQFRADGTQLPGWYEVDVYLNKRFVTHQKIKFETVPAGDFRQYGDTGLYPCMSRSALSNIGLKVELFPELNSVPSDKCVNLTEYVSGAHTLFDFQRMRLEINAPQMYSRSAAPGEVDPHMWDEGITAALLNYRFNGDNNFASKNASTNYFLSLEGGLNVGPWRLRDYRNWSYYDSAYARKEGWQRQRTFAERTIIPLKSELVVGEDTTGSDVFDSLGFRGVQMASDDTMLPNSKRGFAPVVRGTADSNSEISIRQNGYTIYRTTVSPGPFEITDLNTMYSSGDLEVSVKDASGRIKQFTVPFSSLPSLQRQGKVKYSLTAGQFRGGSDRYESPYFAQGTFMWGLPHDITLYGGSQFSSDYLSVQSGAGVNMGSAGAISADITHARSSLADGNTYQGQSLRFIYAHAFDVTNTTFRLAGYRYSTKGFHTLDETALKKMSGRLHEHNDLDEEGQPVIDTWSDVYDLKNSKRARVEANITQKLGDYGSLWFTGMRQTYWNSTSETDSLNLGYSNEIGPASYSLNYSFNHYKNNNAPSYEDRVISLSLSVPLNKLIPGLSDHYVNATAYGSHDSEGNYSLNTGLSGQMLEGNNLSWNLSKGYDRTQGSRSDAGMSYRGTYGDATLGYSQSQDWHQVNYGVSGGLLLHRNGLTLGQSINGTSVLIATPGVSGIGIKNEPGVKTDWHGYAIKPYASPYRESTVQLDTDNMDSQTDVDQAITHVVPTKDAIVRADFNAHRGYRILMTLKNNGRVLPFGTIVTTDESSGIVAEDGLVYLSGQPESGTLVAKWGSDSAHQCHARYQLAKTSLSADVPRISVNCN